MKLISSTDLFTSIRESKYMKKQLRFNTADSSPQHFPLCLEKDQHSVLIRNAELLHLPQSSGLGLCYAN